MEQSPRLKPCFACGTSTNGACFIQHRPAVPPRAHCRTTSARGYGNARQRARKQWQPQSRACRSPPHADDTHLWTSRNGGQKLAATLRRNAGMMDGRSLERRTRTRSAKIRWQNGHGKPRANGAPGLLYDPVETPHIEDLNDRDAVRAALKVADKDARRVPLERIGAEIADPSTNPSDSGRFHSISHKRAANCQSRSASPKEPARKHATASRISDTNSSSTTRTIAAVACERREVNAR